MRKNILLFTLLGLLSRCQKDWTPPPSEAPRLVIWGWMHPDSIVKVQISESYALSDTALYKPKLLRGVEVVLFENNQAIDTLVVDEKAGAYISAGGQKPQLGRSYHFKASAKGLPVLTTHPDMIPEAPEIQDYTQERVERKDEIRIDIVVRLKKARLDKMIGNRISYLNAKGGIKELGTFGWYDKPCSYTADIKMNDYYFENYDCLGGFDAVALKSLRVYVENIRYGFIVSPAVLSPASQRVAFKLGLFNFNNTNNNDVNAFYEPIPIDFNTDNGFGQVFFMNSFNIKIPF